MSSSRLSAIQAGTSHLSQQAPSTCLPCAQAALPAPTCSIVSQTVAAVPADRARRLVGVGEEVTLTFSAGSAAWTTPVGKLSASEGASVTFTAPDHAAIVTITATGGGCTASIEFHVIEPSGVVMKRVGGAWHNRGMWHKHGTPSVGMRLRIYITPDTVFFGNIEVMEDACVSAVTGYFVGTALDGVPRAGRRAGTWVTVGEDRMGLVSEVEGQATMGSVSEVEGQDTVQSGYCDYGTPYRDGTFDWLIPWKFRVGSGAGKVFATVHQGFTINAGGAMTVSKGGATAHADLNDADSTY